MILQAIWEGICCGLLLALMVGPVFFGLLQTSIEKGFYKAVSYAIGVAFSDLFYIVLTYVGIAQLIRQPRYEKWFVIGGGVIMCCFGIYYLTKHLRKSVPLIDEKETRTHTRLVLKGFLLNVFNPAVLVFWLGPVTYVTNKFNHDKTAVFAFLSMALATAVSLDITKAYFAHRIKYLITDNLLNIMNKILGLAFFASGVWVLYEELFRQ